uniref:Uncharacterized protein MANES_17G051900 n=1 Tax=Rhizophora mucronata TaxID=61149 RepID=A0A2P2QMW6_RHIMU
MTSQAISSIGGSLGFIRTSGFATGFNLLPRKPLDSIVDVKRANKKCPQDQLRCVIFLLIFISILNVYFFFQINNFFAG